MKKLIIQVNTFMIKLNYICTIPIYTMGYMVTRNIPTRNIPTAKIAHKNWLTKMLTSTYLTRTTCPCVKNPNVGILWGSFLREYLIDPPNNIISNYTKKSTTLIINGIEFFCYKCIGDAPGEFGQLVSLSLSCITCI